MFTAFMITLREGIEAFLIVAITLTYLRKTGRDHLAPAVYWGVLIAVGTSYFSSLLFAQADNKPLWEGVLALITAVLVATFTVHVLRTAKVLKAHIESRLETVVLRSGQWAFLGVLGFTVLMITREGMEAALLLTNSFIQSDSRNFFIGAVLGLAAAAILAMLWGRYGHRVNLVRFLQVTAIFLILFVVQLTIYGLHELTETGLLPIDNAYWHIATEDLAEGRIAQWISFSLLLVPLAWLAFSLIRGRAQAKPVAEFATKSA
ncbi:MAG: FTR1 family protein [Methylotenera sp.]|nr:FTR1 family protein [Methylotenera sp.]